MPPRIPKLMRGDPLEYLLYKRRKWQGEGLEGSRLKNKAITRLRCSVSWSAWGCGSSDREEGPNLRRTKKKI